MSLTSPGSVKFYKLELRGKTNGACLDITPQVKNISIYESIYTPTVFCEVLMEDSIDRWRTFPINGEEQLEVSYKTVGHDDVTVYKFDIFRMKNKEDRTTDKTSYYILQGISAESITGASVGKLNTFFNEPIEDIIQYLLSKVVKTKKQLYPEKTKGTIPITIPNLYAFQAINYLQERAVSAEVPNSSFVFFENQHGFHFRTIESLFATKRGDIGSKEFTYDSSAVVSGKPAEGKNFRTIVVLNKNNMANMMQNVGGSYKNVVENFDVITKEVDKVEHNFLKKATQFIASDKISSPFNTQEFLVDLDKATKKAKTFFGSKDSSNKSDLLPDVVGNKFAYKAMFATLDTDILVYGDSSLTVGEPVTIKTPNTTGTTGRITDEAKVSGIYLITALRQVMSPGPGAVHYTAMKLQKMGYSV